jgi:Mycoplasma protein of unknown function, DUF285
LTGDTDLTLFNTFMDDISKWNTSKARSMFAMFSGAAAFDQELSSWVVSTVSDMSYMFSGAVAFNEDSSLWGVSAKDMSNMFSGTFYYISRFIIVVCSFCNRHAIHVF